MHVEVSSCEQITQDGTKNQVEMNGTLDPDEPLTYRGGSADPDGGASRGRGGPLGDVGHRRALLHLGLSLSQNLLRDHDQLTRLRPHQNHTWTKGQDTVVNQTAKTTAGPFQ